MSLSRVENPQMKGDVRICSTWKEINEIKRDVSRKKINIDRSWSVFLLYSVRTRGMSQIFVGSDEQDFCEAVCLKNAFTVRNFPEPYDNNSVTIRASMRRAARWKTKKIICSGYRNKRYDRLPVYRGIFFLLSLFLSISFSHFPLCSSSFIRWWGRILNGLWGRSVPRIEKGWQGSGKWELEGERARGKQKLYTFLRIRRVIPFVRHWDSETWPVKKSFSSGSCSSSCKRRLIRKQGSVWDPWFPSIRKIVEILWQIGLLDLKVWYYAFVQSSFQTHRETVTFSTRVPPSCTRANH